MFSYAPTDVTWHTKQMEQLFTSNTFILDLVQSSFMKIVSYLAEPAAISTEQAGADPIQLRITVTP